MEVWLSRGAFHFPAALCGWTLEQSRVRTCKSFNYQREISSFISVHRKFRCFDSAAHPSFSNPGRDICPSRRIYWLLTRLNDQIITSVHRLCSEMKWQWEMLATLGIYSKINDVIKKNSVYPQLCFKCHTTLSSIIHLLLALEERRHSSRDIGKVFNQLFKLKPQMKLQLTAVLAAPTSSLLVSTPDCLSGILWIIRAPYFTISLYFVKCFPLSQ